MDFFAFDENDYVVRVRPTVINNEWTGEIDIAIVTSADNNLEDDSYNQMMHFTKMMCATVPLMEMNDDMRDYVHTYVMEELDNSIMPMVEDKEVTITKEDGNVVRIDFGTKTKGSA